MAALTRTTAALLVSVALVWAANGLCFTLLALRLGAEGFSSLDVGIVTTGYFAGQLVGAVFCMRLIEGVGHVRAFAAFASVISASAIGYALHVDLVVWTGLRFIHGVCIAGLLTATESWLNSSTANANRGRLLAVYTIIQYVAISAGQQLLNLHVPSSFVLFTVSSILFSLALVPLVLSRSAPTGAVAPSRLGLRALYEITPSGVTGCLSAGAMMSILFGLLPVYLRDSGFAVFDVALFMSVVILGGLVVQYPIGRASDYLDRRSVLTAVLMGGGLMSLVIAVLPDLGFWPLAVLVTAYAGVCSAIYPLSVSHANDHLDPADLVAASAGLIMAAAMGAAIGPLVTSAVMQSSGPRGLFLTSSVICLVAGGFAVWRMTRRAPPARDDQGPYVLVPRTTPAVAELDPRADIAWEGQEEHASGKGELRHRDVEVTPQTVSEP
ncbi:MAG: MFS transporter [Alphaproteobacteria bacterium]|nr:MFS transporter [Alphaproteobacteria bacterium]